MLQNNPSNLLLIASWEKKISICIKSILLWVSKNSMFNGGRALNDNKFL